MGCDDNRGFQGPQEPKQARSEPRTTDYCAACGQSPEAADHALGKCAYVDPRLSPQDAERANQAAERYYKAPKELLANLWLPHIFHDPHFRAAIEECDKILKVKGADYTQKQPDRLANFKEAAQFLGQNKFQVLGVYLYKHLTAVFSFLKHGQVESEPIEGRIYDCINYLLLLYKMVAEEKALQLKSEDEVEVEFETIGGIPIPKTKSDRLDYGK